MRPASGVSVVVNVEDNFGVKGQARPEHVVLLGVRSEFVNKLAEAGPRLDVRRDARAHAHVGRIGGGAVDEAATIHRPKVDVRHVHQLHGRLLEVLHFHDRREERLTRIELDRGRCQIVVRKGHSVLIVTMQADEAAVFVFADDQQRVAVGRVGQFTMQRMRVPCSRNAHGRDAAVNHERTVGVEINTRGAGLLEHGLHGQFAPAKTGRPDLLPLEGKQHQFAQAVAEPQRANAALKAEDGSGQFAVACQRHFLFAKHDGHQANACAIHDYSVV